MIQSLRLDLPIEVKLGDYTGAWKGAKITYVVMEIVSHDDESNTPIYGLSFSVEYEDGITQRVTDAFGFNETEWRYKE